MTKTEQIQSTIAANIAKWDKQKTLAEYARDHLSEIDESIRSKPKIDNVLDALYMGAVDKVALPQDRAKSAEILLKVASADQKPSTQINQQFNYGHDAFVLNEIERK